MSVVLKSIQTTNNNQKRRDRDRLILDLLTKFRVLSRDQIGQLTCPTVANPAATVNRIMKRMARDGIVTVIPRTKDVPYIYMPKPHIIRPDSPFINHYLGLVDTFIEIGKPRRFTIEPDVVPGKYRPDAYWMPDNADPVIIEYQRTRESVKDMQAKVDTFVKYHNVHKARTLWIKTAIPYTLRIADGFRLIVAEHLNNR